MTSQHRVPLSVLDLAPVPSGSTGRAALRATLDLARRAEEFGYRRYWVAEHHLTEGVASAAPAVLIALIASATSRIRVGSGAVLLGYYAPAAVAEQFGTIAAVHPGRIDLGLGRSGLVRPEELAARFAAVGAGGPPAANRLIGGVVIPPKPRSRFGDPEVRRRFRERQELLIARQDAGHDYLAEVGQVLGLLAGTYRTPSGEPLHAPAAEGAALQVWVLGSGPGASAEAAGRLGLPYVANYHVSPSTLLESVEAYRAAFVPSRELARPHVVVSADVVVAEEEAKARELASPYARWVLSIRAGDGAIPFPTPEESARHPWTEEERALVADRVDTQIVGDPASVVDRLSALREVTGADELLITTITHAHEDRVRSYGLLARAWRPAP
ncbi:MsnO8 family LLM class oxidoreductase [Streptomyces hoynatensis]|uniref:MsnO8 family LLM class oxidoreductase n=1 Tax=Streptomyces hoynatensis TaxID=1141874 RepID=A0A3A9ZBE5_9ACTN|nr:MsnO8 family LLM class oxidoreductase [Streptomyces hoynatensis]RKN45772.1 MsnO8 family LLM class oxidoreductase [Streptomyces hoynatensis]